MYSFELFEAGATRIVVTYPGRFQPFHQGHAGVFHALQKKFGNDNVYIVTSNDQSSAKSPFNFSDKYQLMTAAGIPANHIIEGNQMYKLPEGFDPETTVFVTAVGAPDAKRLNPDSYLKRDNAASGKKAGDPSYFLTWGKNDAMPAMEHGYVVVVPEIKKSIVIDGQTYDVSHGTECRNLWIRLKGNEKGRAEFLKQLYGRATPELAHIFDKIQPISEDEMPDGDYSTSPIHGGNVREDASGYIPKNKKEARDPRWSNALTVDVHPDTPMKNLRAFKLAETINPDDFHIHDTDKLDRVLAHLCKMIIQGQQDRPDYYGMVASAVIDPKNQIALGINYLADEGKRVHGERAAIDEYNKKYGEIPEGSIIVTTLSPCCSPMDERYGESCTDLINDTNVHKVYCGYKDPSQEETIKKLFHTAATRNDKLQSLCKDFADTFLGVISEDEEGGRAMMGKLADTGKIVRILRKQYSVPFSQEKEWLLIDTDPEKGNRGLGIKWVPASTKFTWIRPFREKIDENKDSWQKHKNPRAGGMSKKAVKSYRRSHPGSKIKTAVTKSPKKIKKGSADAKRRSSFCARMKGMKKSRTSAKTARDPNSNINKSLRRWHCNESINSNSDAEFPNLLAKFLPIAMQDLKLDKLPKIKLEKHIQDKDGQATFGRFVNNTCTIHLAIADRHPVDILRTLAHELTHYKQYTLNELTSGSGRTGSPEENQAHVMAGIIMRHFNKSFPTGVNLTPIELKS